MVIGFLLGLLILVEPYISPYVSLEIIGMDIPYIFSLLVVFFCIICFILFFLVNKIITHDKAKTFIILYIVSLQAVALSPLPKINIDDIVLLAYLIMFIISRAVEQKGVKVTFLDVLNLGFLSVLIIPTVYAIYERTDSVVGFITAVKSVVLSFLIINFCSNKELLKLLIKWLIITTCISAIIGIVQEALFFLAGVSLVGFIQQKEFHRMFESTSQGPLLRIPAFTGTYAFLVYSLASGIVITLNVLLYLELSRKRKTLLYAVLGIMFIALILTFSRFTLLAFFIIASLIFFVRWSNYSFHMVPVIVLSVLLLYITGYYKDIYASILHEVQWGEFRIRLQLDSDGIYGFFNQYPWIGRGMGLGNRYTSNFNHWGAHNAFIRVADDAGLLGLFAYCLLIFYSLVRVILLNIRIQNLVDVDKGIVRGLLFSFCIFLIMIQFDSTYLVIYLWFFMGAINAAYLIYASEERNIAFQT